MELIYKDLTHRIRRCIYDVHNALGTGYDEETYHNALILSLKKVGIPVRSKERRVLIHRDREIKKFELDLIVFDKIILELKSIQCDFLQPNYVQIISYLKLWQKHLGLLVNFGLPKAKIKRIPFTEKEKSIIEDYSYIEHLINHENREHLKNLRAAILSVHELHGLGFGENIYQGLIEAELDFRKVKYEIGKIIPVEYEGHVIRKFEMKLPLIEDKFVCLVTAIHDRIDFYDIAKLKTYMKALNIKIGLIVNFGKSSLEIHGVSI